MFDKIEELDGSIIQHGKYNDRIYLMNLKTTGQTSEDTLKVLKKIENLASKKNYSKIFVKVPAKDFDIFKSKGYLKEASIKGFYNGKAEVFFMGKFFSESRKIEHFPDKVKDIIGTSKSKKPLESSQLPEPVEFTFHLATPKDSKAIAEVYQKVFKTYPFPIHDPKYIEKTMEENHQYFTLWDGDKLAAVSSTEMYPSNNNVEMTDFATLPQYRGNNLAIFLLAKMEERMNKEGYITAFTIARAYSYGMNITFAKMGYTYSGTLVNNTNISGSLESMNIWYKAL
jgi:putative beta-lysine N-acetyltransferase